MTVVFISNYLSIHQRPFCNEMYQYFKYNFWFIACSEISEERIQLGWSQEEPMPYELRRKESKHLERMTDQLIDDSDIVIIGSAPDQLIHKRLKARKMTIKYCERLYKGSLTGWLWIRAYIGAWIHYARYLKYPFYVLCASGYTSADLNKICDFHNRVYKWGYFPETKQYSDLDGLIKSKKSSRISILWVGRLLKFKHPELSLFIAEKLKEYNVGFYMKIVGNGEMWDELANLIDQKKLNSYVQMLGAMKPEEVRKQMEKSEIFLFTSDSNEGWGVVLNEAMNSGCAVVASHVIGSVPYLICNGVNGIIYRNGDFDDLLQKVLYLVNNPSIRYEMGRKAYFTITKEWNTEIAVKNLLVLLEELRRKGESNRILEGPCSKAEIIDDNGKSL